ncbi:DUF3867 domain-containing protein [Caproiciproducens sp. MSJ-32]|uniref:DUF3867 domain-containing protein n=1 Tax=Caproiciproducens sp. MSJ-32 TaxID=2841527 RepID=UPI001C107252|nr:DUF3867 domain-containing protein [Caproiciproducens sp. MSJ-32]MBU5454899.1 DUF3867 domain-containing protein [Caproiciproducens sp. MSJ-32]
MDDRIIDFNEIKNRVNEKDLDKFEAYIFSLYYEMSNGKLNMAEFSKKVMEYMEKNNISQDKFMKMQTKLMERYGFDPSELENQLKALGIESIIPGGGDIEKARKTLSFQEKYKDRLKVKTINSYPIENDKNKLEIITDGTNVILISEKNIDLNDIELNEFLCSYKKLQEDNSLKIYICENTREYIY